MKAKMQTSAQPLNVLLVDDQASRLLSYESVLAPLGEKLIRANSGAEALDTLLHTPVAVILVDVVMPELDGYELARMIRAHPRFSQTAIILVSGVMTEDVNRLKGYDSGAVDYISVPIVPEILRAKVGVFCDLYRKTQALEKLNLELETRVAERTAESERARKDAVAANQIKDDFLATLSHELRTPLNAIAGWTHLLQIGALDADEQRKAAEIIHRNVQNQARLVSDLLDISRIVSGKLRLELQPVQLEETITAAIASLQPEAEAKHIEIETTIEPTVARIEGDPVRMQQIAFNLIANAIKYAPEGGKIEVGIRPFSFTVRDNGPGIAPALLPHIFERFRQGDHSSTRLHRGLGLGLAIVRSLVEAHGGEVRAGNRGSGSGAEFSVKFRSSGMPAAAAALPAPIGAAAATLEGLRILVVDDEPDAREVVARILETSGAVVRVAASVAVAMDIFSHGDTDIVLTDIEMPVEDGYKLVELIRASAAPRPAVALTAYAGPQDRDRLLSAGFKAHLTKPVQAPELLRTLAGVSSTVVR